jgi:glycosyltransferase involved in cell wall biosynthesis
MSPISENGIRSVPPGKIGVVALRYGPDVLGGAERILRGMAEQLRARGYDVEVLTTCGRDMGDWKNHYPAGETLVNGVPVRRFPIDQVDMGQIFRTLHKLVSGERVPYSEQIKFIQQHFNSLALCQYIRDHQEEFACFIFGPYLFGTTYWGMQAAGDKGVLLPCLHDEPVAYLSIYRELLEQARGILFNANAERRFAIEKLGMINAAYRVVGYGFDPATPRGDEAAFRARYNLPEQILLYSGRLDAGKNVHVLLDYFARYKSERPGPLTLALCGTGDVMAGGRPDVAELGFFDEAPLRDAYAAATLLCQPSVNESFSLVIMEAWLQDTPVLVHGDCAVTREHVEASGGGWAFRDYDEFRAVLDQAFGDRAARDERGHAGRAYVAREYNWDAVMGRLAEALAEFARPLSLYDQLSRRGVRRALDFSRERFEERFADVIARAEADLSQGLSHAEIDALRAAARVAMPDYQVRSNAPVVGNAIASLRRNLTSHLREPYLDPIIDRQETYNKLILDVLLPALERNQHNQQRLERQVRLLEQQIRELRGAEGRRMNDEGQTTEELRQDDQVTQ